MPAARLAPCIQFRSMVANFPEPSLFFFSYKVRSRGITFPMLIGVEPGVQFGKRIA